MRPAGADDDGGVALLPLLLWALVLVTVAGLDLGAYLVARSQAGTAADAAALAAVSTDASLAAGSPRGAAEEVTAAQSAQLESCACAPGQGAARVRVAVETFGVVLPRLGLDRAVVESEAVLVPPADV